MNFPGQGFHKLEQRNTQTDRQTDTQTDATERITMPGNDSIFHALHHCAAN